MFIRLSHRIKRAIVKNWKIDLFLTVMACFPLLTVFAYSIPAATAIIFYTILGYGLSFACVGFLAVMFNFPNEGYACAWLAIICIIFAAVILKGRL